MESPRASSKMGAKFALRMLQQIVLGAISERGFYSKPRAEGLMRALVNCQAVTFPSLGQACFTRKQPGYGMLSQAR